MTIGILILAFQALMFLLTTFRSGGPFYSQRRTLYWVLYILLFTVTLVLLLMARRLHKGKPPKSAAYLRVETTYIGLICLWACCITLLDQRGDSEKRNRRRKSARPARASAEKRPPPTG